MRLSILCCYETGPSGYILYLQFTDRGKDFQSYIKALKKAESVPLLSTPEVVLFLFFSYRFKF